MARDPALWEAFPDVLLALSLFTPTPPSPHHKQTDRGGRDRYVPGGAGSSGSSASSRAMNSGDNPAACRGSR